MDSFEFKIVECWFVDASEWGLNPEEHQTLAKWKENNQDFVYPTLEWEEENFKGLMVDESADMCDVDGKQLIFLTEEAAIKYSEREPLVASGLRKIQHAVFFEINCLDDDGLDFIDVWWSELFDSFSHDLYLSSHYGDNRSVLLYTEKTEEIIEQKKAEIRELFEQYRKEIGHKKFTL